HLALHSTTAARLAAPANPLPSLHPHTSPGTSLQGREALHLRAARAWTAGDLTAATRALERALIMNPRDALALKVAQDLYFFLGSRLDLRDVAARVLRSWPQ